MICDGFKSEWSDLHQLRCRLKGVQPDGWHTENNVQLGVDDDCCLNVQVVCQESSAVPCPRFLPIPIRVRLCKFAFHLLIASSFEKERAIVSVV